MNKYFCTIITLLFVNGWVGAQQISESSSAKDSLNFLVSRAAEKVYLHLDRSVYASGENICFKAYLVYAVSNELCPVFDNLHV